MRLTILCVPFAVCLLSSQLPATGAGEICGFCDRKITVTGEFTHAPVRDFQKIEGSRHSGEDFSEAVTGTNFTLTLFNFEPGRYTVRFGFAETHFTAPSQRQFDIVSGGKTLLSNLDIFARAGGSHNICHVTNQVDHSADAAQGALSFVFRARKDAALFNTFELRTPSGQLVLALNAADLLDAEAADALKTPATTGPDLWKDPAQPVNARVKDLVSRLSLAEKAAVVRNDARAIPRLGLPAYDYWSEGLHGVGRAGFATVFPQPIGLAATWDVALLRQTADAIATEARAKHHEYARTNNGSSARYFGLTLWAPGIDIVRDPRWGRSQETYGEDPFLTARLGVAFIRGLQGDDPKYLKTMACAKHFAAHAGPESERHRFNAAPPERDFYETYLPQFEAAVREGRAGAVMSAYNRVFGNPASTSPLLANLLRTQWGFNGHVVSDCGAVYDVFAAHKTAGTPEEAVARAIKAGCDLCCGVDFNSVIRAVKKGLLTEAELNGAVSRLLEARFRLGLFDPPASVPFAQIPVSQNNSPEHDALALEAARKSIVLLKNNGVLPLNRDSIRRIAVIGANADSVDVLLGTHHGTPSKPVKILDGIRSLAGTNITVNYQPGCPLALRDEDSVQFSRSMFTNALNAAWRADVVIYVGGLNPRLEGGQMGANYVGFKGGDRTQIELPEVQTGLLKVLHLVGKPVIFVNCSGGAVAMPWESTNLAAIVQAWYPGQQGGRAVAEVLFGETNPGGRLPVTFYASTRDLPAFGDYAMTNRSYRYFNGKPLYAFGHGLSYTAFNYRDAQLERSTLTPDATLKLNFSVANTGKRDGDEVVQVYYRHLRPAMPQAKRSLCGFARIHVPRDRVARVSMEIPVERFRHWDPAAKAYAVEPGGYELLIGGASDDTLLRVPVNVVAR